jgi:hypothetical protein
VTPAQKIALVYTGWLAVCSLAAWFLSRWAARHPPNGGARHVLFAVFVLVTLVNLAQLIYILGFGDSLMDRPRNALEKFLQHTDRVWYLLYALWPFLAAIGIAQTSLKISSSRPALARWIAFGSSVVIAALTPGFLIFTTCGLAGMCID